MATRYIRYPTITAGGGGGSEQALSPNGGPLPSEIKIVGGYDGSNVQVLSVDSSGYLNVNAAVTFPSSITVDQATAANLNATVYQGGTWSVTAEGSTIGTDIFGTAVTTSRYNQLEISFDTSPSSSLITNTTSGGGSGGSITNSNGHELYSSGTATTSQAKGVSTQSVKYRPGSEVYSYFTAAFTTPTSANSYQRIGIYDTNNGFFIGYNGTSFGVTLRTGAADTFTARASWNGDPLDGTSGSKFTRNGVPEAINFTYSNVYRIRFGWLGSASIYFEVLSPDEEWIIFNTIRVPNTQLNPSIQNPDLPMTIDVKKTSADATNLVMATGCWAAGASSNVQPITTTLTDNSLATLTRAVITGYSSAGGGSYNNVKVTPSGSLTVAIGDITGIVGQNTMANSIPVVIASNQSAVPVSGSVTVSGTVAATQSGTWNINNITGTVSLPTGAATEATLLSLDGKVTTTVNGIKVDGSAVTQPISGSVSVSNFPATQPVSGTVTANQGGTWNLNNISGTISLPTGAATESTLSTLNGKVPSGLTVTSTRLLVDGSGVTQPVSGTVAATQSGNWSTRTQDGSGNAITSTTNALDINIKSSNITFGGPGGRSSFLLYRNVYSSVNVTTAAYTVVSASLASNCNIIDIYDSSGQTLVIATGAAGAEVQKAYIYPGGPGQIPLAIAAGTRVTIRAISANATLGEINMTFYT